MRRTHALYIFRNYHPHLKSAHDTYNIWFHKCTGSLCSMGAHRLRRPPNGNNDRKPSRRCIHCDLRYIETNESRIMVDDQKKDSHWTCSPIWLFFYLDMRSRDHHLSQEAKEQLEKFRQTSWKSSCKSCSWWRKYLWDVNTAMEYNGTTFTIRRETWATIPITRRELIITIHRWTCSTTTLLLAFLPGYY